MNDTTPKEFLRTHEAEKVFEISRSTLYKWLDSGVIRSVRVNGVILIPISEIKRLGAKANSNV